MFLKCSSNNLSQTVLNLFVQASERYGLPFRIRCDKGVENYDVAMYMLSHPQRRSHSNPVIVGKSVHNQRIEREMCSRELHAHITTSSIIWKVRDCWIL